MHRAEKREEINLHIKKEPVFRENDNFGIPV